MVRAPNNAARQPRRRATATAIAASAPTPTVLLTGFDAFDGSDVNPSWMVAKALHGRRIGGHQIVGAQLPTVFGRSLRELSAQLERHRPTLVICLGLARGRDSISLERVAINIDDARIADNDGARPIDSAVVSGGPAAYFTGLPIKAMLDAMRRAGVAAEVSQTAGTFVCNHVFYGLMHGLATCGALEGVRGGFVHLPFLPEQGAPSMPLDAMLRGVRAAIRRALRTKQDLSLGAGSNH